MRGLNAHRGQTYQEIAYEDAILRQNGEHWVACGEPQVWAQYRHALVKGLPWYNSTEAGVLLSPQPAKNAPPGNEVCMMGMFLNSFSNNYAYFDAEVVIANLYGTGSDPNTIARRRKAVEVNKTQHKYVGVVVGRLSPPDHEDPDSKAVKKSKRVQPSEGALFPCPMPKNQEGWVTGFYIVTDYWSVREMPKEDTKKGKHTRAKEFKASAKESDTPKVQDNDDDGNNVEVDAEADDEEGGEGDGEGDGDGEGEGNGEGEGEEAEASTASKLKASAKPDTQAQSLDGSKTVTMVRLERWDIENKAWYAKIDPHHDPPPLAARQYDLEATQECCQTCGQESTRLFKEHFLCLHESCSEHWRLNGKLCTEKLTYRCDFLQKRAWRKFEGSQNTDTASPGPYANVFTEWVRQNYDTLDAADLTQRNFKSKMEALSAGFLCPQCGMLGRRLKWHKWDCNNDGCNFEYVAPPPVLSPQVLENLTKTPKQAVTWEKLFTQAPATDPPPPPATAKITYSSKPVNNLFTIKDDNGGYDAFNYDLEQGCGITVLVPKDGTNASANGADRLWIDVLKLANDGTIPLAKNFVSSGSSSAGITTNHFIANFGEDYQLGVNMRPTIPWENTPQVLKDARNVVRSLTSRYQLKNPGTDTLAAGEGDMNECYVAAYFSQMAMNWHDDGEKGLGSVVATWTLGGTGRMQIALKPGHFYGKHAIAQQNEDRAFLREDHALPGCWLERKRKALKATLDNVYAANPNARDPVQKGRRDAAHATWFQNYKNLLNQYRVRRGQKSGQHVLLDIPLPHGSIAVMRGAKTQQFYDHKITVDSPLRIALTFRYISPEHALDKAGNKIEAQRSMGEYIHVPDESWMLKYPLKMWKERVAKGGPEKNPTARQQSDNSAKGKGKQKEKRIPPDSAGDGDAMEDVQATSTTSTKKRKRSQEDDAARNDGDDAGGAGGAAASA